LKHLILKLFCILFCTCSADEQVVAQVNNNTVFQRLFNGAVTTGASVPVRNIGQQYHLLIVSITPGTAPCNLGEYEGLIRLEASTDDINWVPLGAPIIVAPPNNSSPYAVITSASGAYAYVRANYIDAFTSSCPMTAYYSGSITGTLTGSAPFTSIQDTFQYAALHSTSAATVQVAICPPLTLPQLYSAIISTPGGPQTVTLSASSSVPMEIWQLGITTIAGSTPTVIPQGSRPYIAIPALFESATVSYSISVTTTAATAADTFLSYRCE
jgi:hypothetical protein